MPDKDQSRAYLLLTGRWKKINKNNGRLIAR